MRHMVRRSNRHWISTFLAVLLLTLSVVSRAPQSKCRCHERKSARQQQQQDSKPCVFGQLRSLTASFVLPADVEADEANSEGSFIESNLALVDQVSSAGFLLRARARSPPRLS